MATNHKIVTREEWLAARLELLAAEKALTHRSDSVAQQRQALPWERVQKAYEFDTDEGKATLKDLFKGRSQLLVYHFMFGPGYQAGCPSCSAIADGFNGFAVHLANHDVTLMAVSRAPLARLLAYKQRLGWTFPWASSYGGEFNYDFNVSITEEQQRRGGSEYNYERGGHALDDARTIPEPVRQFAARCGTDAPTYMRDRPGMSTWMACGACTSGWTARRSGATSTAPGGSATTSTAGPEPWWRIAPSSASRHCCFLAALPSPSPGAAPCPPCRAWKCRAAGPCRWRGCACPARAGPAPPAPFSACGR
jgi:predicted dithiol-disulfide oxidoreductase (DUF899 family)